MDQLQINIDLNGYLTIIAITMQIPIIFLILIYTGQAKKYYEEYKNAFTLILIGWIFNLIYVLLVGLKEPIISFFALDRPLYKVFIDFFNLGYGFFFLIGSLNSIIKRKSPKILFISISLLFIFSYLYVTTFYFREHDFLRVITIGRAFYFLVCISAFTLFAFRIDKLFIKKNANISNIVRFKIPYLTLGISLYSILQIIIIIDLFNELRHLLFTGWWISLIAKVLIAFGLHRLLIIYAADKSYINEISSTKRKYFFDLKDTLGQTYHDMFRPLRNVNTILKTLGSTSNPQIYYSSKVEKLLSELNSAFEILDATYGAQRIIYEEYISRSKKFTGKKDEFRKDLFELKDYFSDKEKHSIKINRLIEVVLVIHRRELKEKGIKIKREYAGRCNLRCNEEQLLRTISNIIKNSIDAIEHAEGLIYVKTSNLENHSGVIIEISDNGIGIPEEIIDNVKLEGVTTKTGALHGKGLTIADLFVKLHNGTLDIISPYKSSLLNTINGGGTLVRIKLQNS